MNFTDLFDARAIAAYWTETRSDAIPYLGTGYFPKRKKAGLDISWIKGNKGLPITLMPSTFDAKARFRDRIGVSKIETEMPFFREGFLIKEKDRQDILRAQESADPYVTAVLDRIFDDASNLIEGAAVVPERMIMQLLSPIDGSPKININANGVDYSYNYDPNGTYQSTNFMEITTTADKWSATTSKPLDDLQEAQDAIEESTGTKPTVALMSKKTFNYLLQNEQIRSAVLAQNATANIFMTGAVVNAIINQFLGISIVVYNKKFIDDAGQAQQFYPDDMVTLLPSSPVGSTWYGTTPEEADLMGSSEASVQVVDTGVAVTTILIPHPVNIETLASEIVLPSYEGMDGVYVMKVA